MGKHVVKIQVYFVIFYLEIGYLKTFIVNDTTNCSFPQALDGKRPRQT